MSEDRVRAYADWIRANQDKQGTPEYVRVTQAYRELRQAPITPAAPQQDGLVDRGMNMLGRVGTNMITGPMDMAALAANKFAEKTEGTWLDKLFSGGQPAANVPWGGADNNASRVPYAGPALREQIGIKEQDPNAGYIERGIETALNVIAGRNAMGVTAPTTRQAVTQVAAPTVGSIAGEDIGRAIGGEDGAILGSIVGGGGGSIAGNIATRPLALMGGANAGAIYDAGQNVGARVTAGQVGNGGVKWLEKSIGALPLAGWGINRAREQASQGIEAARDRAINMITQGGSVGVEPGQRGGALITGAQQAESRIQKALSAEQDALERNIGSQTPVRIRPALDASRAAASSTDDINAAPILARANQLESMSPTGATARDPTAPIETVPYGVAKDFRTNINTKRDGLDPVAGHLQDPITSSITDAMREAARFRGVERDFDFANTRYAQAQPTLQELRRVGGEYDPRSGMHRDGLDAKQADNFINHGLSAPERLAPFADTLDPRAWNYVAGSTIAGMGQQPRGGFRPDMFAQQWGGVGESKGVNPQSAALLTQNAPRAQAVLDDAATLGRAYNIPVAAEGLSRAIGGLTAASALGAAGYGAFGPWGLPLAMAPSFLMESGPVVRGLAGRATPIADTIYSRMPGMMTGAQYTLPPEVQQ